MAVRDVEWGEPLLERASDPELERRVRREGRIPSASACFSAVPWVYLASVRLNRRLTSRVVLDHDLADLAGLVVSQDNSCRYCYAVQRAMLRGVGFSEPRIAQLEETFLLADLDPAERAALDFARRLSRSNPLVTAGDLGPLRAAGLSEAQIWELSVIAGLNLFFNRFSTIPAMPPQGWEALPDRWYARLGRPFLGMYLRRSVRLRAREVALREDQQRGPFSYLTNALDGHPFAGELRETLDETWRDTHLTRRAKALCFAVVARALSCERSEREASAIAMEEGVSDAVLDDALKNLSSPALDDVERRLLPFSRQTVWYQVPDLQRRARELREHLSKEQFLEVTFVTSLANAVCRLGFLAEAR